MFLLIGKVSLSSLSLTLLKSMIFFSLTLNLPFFKFAEWQIYVLLVSLFVASAIVFYIFYENSDSFWQFPLGRDQPARPRFDSFVGDSQSADDPFGPVDM